MSSRHDSELDDVLQDDELRRIASLLGSGRHADPPLDDAFRSDLRRQLMQQAWNMSEGTDSWWRRAFRPPAMAWMAAAAGVVIIASVVIWYSGQAPAGVHEVVVHSPMDGSNGVALQQPILVAFNQPMDHQATQDAVKITPATTVTFSWSTNTLSVQPTAGVLAPNTQYQVTVGPGAKTASGQPLTTPQTITFVTQTPPAPLPSPTPRSTPAPGSGDKQIASLGGPMAVPVQWSADSSTVYFVNAAGALQAVPAAGGSATVLAPGGVSSMALSAAGDRLAYIRGGKVEVLTLASGHTDEVATPRPATLVGWSNGKVLWTADTNIYVQGRDPAAPIALPGTGAVKVLSIAPDGAHIAYSQDQNLLVIDLGTGKSVTLGQAGASFAGWSPDGTQLIYSEAGSNVVSDVLGNTVATLAPGDSSWSSQDAILLGSDTSLFQVRPDGSSRTKVADGTYRSPSWAPNGTSFAFARGSSLWVASAPSLPPQPTALDQAALVVSSFMDARVHRQPIDAAKYLDDGGKQVYGPGGLDLTVTGDPSLTRSYILAQEITGTTPDTARFVVRLVLTHGKLDVKDFEETLTLVRDPATRQFLIDQATASPQRDLGKGAEVVGVDLAPDTVKVTFDSDLDTSTIAGGVVLVDGNGQPLAATPTYDKRTVTFSGLSLKAGAKYRLEVLTGVRDVRGQNVAAEYDLEFLGPVPQVQGGHQPPVAVSPSPVPTPTPAASPSPSPSPTASPILGP
jgi:hypothetical protein